MCKFVKIEQAVKLLKEFSLTLKGGCGTYEEEYMGVNTGRKDGGMSEWRGTSVKVMI